VVILAACAVLPAQSQNAKRRVQERIEDLIKKALAEQDKKAGTNAASPLQTIYNDIERQYLAGELTARQFMLINQELGLYARTNLDERTLSVLPQQLRARAIAETSPAASTNSPNAEEAAFVDIEKKIDDLIVRNEQFQKTSATNAPPPVVAPKTRREKLDQLLQLFVSDKITRQEYEAQRAKVLSEPDPATKK
jgi:hypothetical protein